MAQVFKLKRKVARLIVLSSFAAVNHGLFEQTVALRERLRDLGIGENERRLSEAILWFGQGRLEEAQAALGDTTGPEATELRAIFKECALLTSFLPSDRPVAAISG